MVKLTAFSVSDIEISGWQKPKHQRQLIQENNPQTQHVHVQIPL